MAVNEQDSIRGNAFGDVREALFLCVTELLAGVAQPGFGLGIAAVALCVAHLPVVVSLYHVVELLPDDIDTGTRMRIVPDDVSQTDQRIHFRQRF